MKIPQRTLTGLSLIAAAKPCCFIATYFAVGSLNILALRTMNYEKWFLILPVIIITLSTTSLIRRFLRWKKGLPECCSSNMLLVDLAINALSATTLLILVLKPQLLAWNMGGF